MKTTHKTLDTMRRNGWGEAADELALGLEAIEILRAGGLAYVADVSSELRTELRQVKRCRECGLTVGHTPCCSREVDWDVRTGYGVHRDRDRDDLYHRLDDIEALLRGYVLRQR